MRRVSSFTKAQSTSSEIHQVFFELGLSHTIAETLIAKRLKSCHPSKMWALEQYPDNCRLRATIEKAGRSTLSDLQQFVSEIFENFELYRVNNPNTSSITALYLDAGDVHPYGRSTTIIETDSGKFVYRPRALSFEQAVSKLLEELDVLNIPIQQSYFGADFTLSRFIETNGDFQYDLRRDLRIIIFTQYIASICGLTDLHFENFLPSKSGLVPLDLEVYHEADRELVQMKTSIFPEYNYQKDKTRFDISPVGNLLEQVATTYSATEMVVRECLAELAEHQSRIHEAARDLFREELIARQVHRPTADYGMLVEYIDNVFFEGKDKKQVLRSRLSKRNPEHLREILMEEVDALVCGYIPVFYRAIGQSVPERLTRLSSSRSASKRHLYVTGQYISSAIKCFYLNRTYPAGNSIPLQQLQELCCEITLRPNSSKKHYSHVSKRILQRNLSQLQSLRDQGLLMEEMFSTIQIPSTSLNAAGQIGSGLYRGIDGVLMYLSQATRQFKTYHDEILQLVFQRTDNLLRTESETSSFDGIADGYSGCLYASIFSLLSLGEKSRAMEVCEIFLSHSFRSEHWSPSEIDLFSGGLGYILSAVNIAHLIDDIDLRQKLEFDLNTFLEFIEKEYLSAAQRNIGFSHGDSGLLYTLVRIRALFPGQKIEPLIEAVIERIFESYAAHGERFRDYRDPKVINQTSYCNGVLGILLACEAADGIQPAPRNRSKLTTLMNAAKLLLLSDNQVATDICCSTLYYRLFMDRERSHKPVSVLTRDGIPSLFKGEAGIAYLLLGKITPIPNVLLLELP